MLNVQQLNCPACGAPVDIRRQAEQVLTCPACGSSLALTDWAEDGRVICRECGTLNSSQDKFCSQCHQTLQAGCPMCYTLNRLSAVRCRKCGIDLQRAWNRQNTWLTEKRRYDQDRREALRQAQLEDRRKELERLLLQLDDPENHPMAIFYLEQYGGEAVDGLIRQLRSPDPDARYGAAHTLGRIGDGRAVPPLIDALQDPEFEVRFWAAAALGRLKAAQAVTALARLLKDPAEEVREAASEALERIGGPQAADALRQTKKSRWWPF
jgi:ribosomal protein L40E